MKPMITFTGEAINPYEPLIEQINIDDIAHSLSLLCRGNGHLLHFYSVAQHSLNCFEEAKARNLSNKIQLACLLHDASESYFADIATPIKFYKNYMIKYIEAEKHMQNIIYNKFLCNALTEDEIFHIERIDKEMLACELDTLSKVDVTKHLAVMERKPNLGFRDFIDVKSEFICEFNILQSETTPNVRN